MFVDDHLHTLGLNLFIALPISMQTAMDYRQAKRHGQSLG